MSTASLQVRKYELEPPSLEDLAQVISNGLQSNFETASATVEQCPDLRQPPFHLAASGICGKPRVADIGGPPFMRPLPDLSRKYDLLSVSRLMEMDVNRGFLLGAGAGPFYALGVNSELMPNVAYEAGGKVSNQTRFAKITENGDVECRQISDETTGFAMMANLFASEGSPGPCLHLEASSRTGKLNFTECIQASLKHAYGDKLISLGGVFIIKNGKANLHVMPDFPSEPFSSDRSVEKWLRYFNMDSPLICLSVFHSGDDQGLALRMEHTHCFSADGQNRGGHYHFDLDETSREVEYEAWFNNAEMVYRIDQPGLP